MHWLINWLWKHIELISIGCVLFIDFSIQLAHFTTLKRIDNAVVNNTIEWTHEVKHFMAPISDYFQTPVAMFVYNLFFTNVNRRRLVANLVTITYMLISIPTIWLLSKIERKYLLYRQLACVIFQIKNIMDCLDGPIIRGGKVSEEATAAEQSTPNYGRVFDGFANGVSTLCFFLGSFVYIWRKHLLNKKYDKKVFETTDDVDVEADGRKFSKTKLTAYVFSFVVYFAVASVGWNVVYNHYTKEVLYNKKFQKSALTLYNFIILHLWRLFSGLSIQDFYCIYVFFGKDLLFMQKYMKILLISMTLVIILTCIDIKHLNYYYAKQ